MTDAVPHEVDDGADLRPIGPAAFLICLAMAVMLVSLLGAMESFPDPASIALLRARDVRTIVVHVDELDGSPGEGLPTKLDGSVEMAVLAREGAILVYELASKT